MTMFRYFPGNEGWSYHFPARIVNVAQLGGAREGFINKAFDRQFMVRLISDPQWATR